jgi:predicted lysophospholipase L1 biosynthesis ABC-type transport system permease subunit
MKYLIVAVLSLVAVVTLAGFATLLAKPQVGTDARARELIQR